MNALVLSVSLLDRFVHGFTAPGFGHFTHFVLAHMALLGVPHCVTETLRLTSLHHRRHWTTPYAFLQRGRWACQHVSQCLLDVICQRLAISGEMVVVDDTLVKKWGRKFFGLGLYRDPTDKNPGAHKRRVWGHCWVVVALLWEYQGGHWVGFPLAALLFVPLARCSAPWPFLSKIELAERLLRSLRWPTSRLIVVVDNLYAKAQLARVEVNHHRCVLLSRLRSNAALYLVPPRLAKPRRGRPRVRGRKVSAGQLYRRHQAQRRTLIVRIYGKTVTLTAYVGVLLPSRRLGNAPLRVIIFPQRSGHKMNIFFATDPTLAPVRLLELYAARFKIADIFDEVKTTGGFADCRQRSFCALKRHATLCLVAYSLLRVLSVTLQGASTIETEPWWCPVGPPSVTRLRRAVFKALRISASWHSAPKVKENIAFKEAA